MEPTINDAKALAYKYRKAGVLIIHFNAGRFGVASYGMTRRRCDALRDVADQIFEKIEAGDIFVPDELVGGGD